MFFFKMFREPAILTVIGRVFHSLDAEQENDPSYIVVILVHTMIRCRLIVNLGSVLAIPVTVKLLCILGLGHSMLYV